MNREWFIAQQDTTGLLMLNYPQQGDKSSKVP
jgi:hypothetical protein